MHCAKNECNQGRVPCRRAACGFEQRSGGESIDTSGGPSPFTEVPELGTYEAAFAWIDRLPTAPLLQLFAGVLCLVLGLAACFGVL